MTSVDGITNGCNPALKRRWREMLRASNDFVPLRQAFADAAPAVAIHLAAQARVHCSLGYLRPYMHAAPVASRPVGAAADPLSLAAAQRLVNIGGGQIVQLMEFIRTSERHLGMTAKINVFPMLVRDMRAIEGPAELVEAPTGQAPCIAVEAGIKQFGDLCASHCGRH